MKFKNWTFMILSVAILALLGLGLTSCNGGGGEDTTKNYTGSTLLGSSASFSVDETAGVINYNIAGVDGKINGVGSASCLNDLYYYIDSNRTEPTYAYFSDVVGIMKTNDNVLVGFSSAYTPVPEGEYTYIDKNGVFHTLSITYTTDEDGNTITTTRVDGDVVQNDSVKYNSGMVIVEDTNDIGMGVRDGNGIDNMQSLKEKTLDFFISSNIISSFGKINITSVNETEATGSCKKTSACSTTGTMPTCNNDASITPINGLPGWFNMKIDSSNYTVFISRSGYFMGVGGFDAIIVGRVY